MTIPVGIVNNACSISGLCAIAYRSLDALRRNIICRPCDSLVVERESVVVIVTP